MSKKTPYKFFCEHCKNAPKNGQWPRNWRWKTEKGFNNHKCYKDEPRPVIKKQPQTDALPFWLEGDALTDCPLCGQSFSYSGPMVPSLHFACPLCLGEIQWTGVNQTETESNMRVCSVCGGESIKRSGQYGEFWGCSEYSKSNPCKGKSSVVSIPTVEYTVRLAPFSDEGDDCRDVGKVALLDKIDQKKLAIERREWWGQHG